MPTSVLCVKKASMKQDYFSWYFPYDIMVVHHYLNSVSCCDVAFVFHFNCLHCIVYFEPCFWYRFHYINAVLNMLWYKLHSRFFRDKNWYGRYFNLPVYIHYVLIIVQCGDNGGCKTKWLSIRTAMETLYVQSCVYETVCLMMIFFQPLIWSIFSEHSFASFTTNVCCNVWCITLILYTWAFH